MDLVGIKLRKTRNQVYYLKIKIALLHLGRVGAKKSINAVWVVLKEDTDADMMVTQHILRCLDK